MRRILIDALPSHPVRVLVLGAELDDLQRDLERVLGGEAELIRVELDAGVDPTSLRVPAGDRSVSAVVLHRCLRNLPPGRLTVVLAECHRVLCDGGRLVVRDRLLPMSRWSQWIGPSLRRTLGMPHTSTDIFALMERVGFWDCLVLRGQVWNAEVVIKGDKVEQRQVATAEEPEEHPSSPAIKIVR